MPRRTRPASGGYNWQHRRMRGKWRRIVEVGNALCVRCQTLSSPGLPNDLVHG